MSNSTFWSKLYIVMVPRQLNSLFDIYDIFRGFEMQIPHSCGHTQCTLVRIFHIIFKLEMYAFSLTLYLIYNYLSKHIGRWKVNTFK